jgi:hypothetical protein
MTRTDGSRQKRAELAGFAGAGVLGAGLGALFAQWALLGSLGASRHSHNRDRF